MMAKVKVRHLLYLTILMIALLAGVISYITLFVNHSGTIPAGNNWNYIRGASPSITNNEVPVTFIGIESCQFCAAERFALFDALSRFGNWTYYSNPVNLGDLPTGNYTTNPSPNALFYRAAEGDWTLNFLNPHLVYSSNYVNFTSVEVYNNGGQPLQTPTQAQNSFMSRYDPSGAVPFTYINNNFFEVGAGSSLVSSSGVILFNFTGYAGSGTPPAYPPSYIISQFNINGSVINKGITTEANYITAWICSGLKNKPNVCSSPEISQIVSKLI